MVVIGRRPMMVGWRRAVVVVRRRRRWVVVVVTAMTAGGGDQEEAGEEEGRQPLGLLLGSLHEGRLLEVKFDLEGEMRLSDTFGRTATGKHIRGCSG